MILAAEILMDITVDRNNKHVIVATLQGGTIYTIDRKNDGSLGEVIAEFTYEGKEPGKVSTIHQCLWDKKKNFLFACAQSRVMVMDRCGPYVMIMRPDSLLRRLSFYPEHGMSPVTQQCTQITSGCICVRRREIKFFSFRLMMKMVPLSVAGADHCAGNSDWIFDASEVMVDPSGKFVLVSNRYTDSIAVYRIDPLTGICET